MLHFFNIYNGQVVLMDYKLVCIDMDGTLLNKQRRVSETSKEVLRKAHEKGVHIVISTGRMYIDAKDYSNFIGVKSPVIASNGAFIKEKYGDEIIYKSILDESLCLKLLNIFSKYDVKPIFYTPEKSYRGSISSKIFIEYLKLKGVFNKSIDVKYVASQKQWNKIFKLEKDNIVKCEAINLNEFELMEIRSELEKINEIEIACSSKDNIEITCKGVSKGRAVKILGSYYNIDREKIMAIGDSENDLSMIEYAGMGIAMGNATDIVKKKAKFITDTNDNEGVAKAINKFVLGNGD